MSGDATDDVGRETGENDEQREVALEDGTELEVPPTIDPDERIEIDEDDLEAIRGDGPNDL